MSDHGSIQANLYHDYHEFPVKNNIIMGTDDHKLYETYKYLVGEFHRRSTKVVSDKEAIDFMCPLLRSFVRENKEGRMADDEFQRLYLVFTKYLPHIPTRNELIVWIKENIDFSNKKLLGKNIGLVKKVFGALVDGDEVKDILTNL